jgi:hypothetical protein
MSLAEINNTIWEFVDTEGREHRLKSEPDSMSGLPTMPRITPDGPVPADAVNLTIRAFAQCKVAAALPLPILRNTLNKKKDRPEGRS